MGLFDLLWRLFIARQKATRSRVTIPTITATVTTRREDLRSKKHTQMRPNHFPDVKIFSGIELKLQNKINCSLNTLPLQLVRWKTVWPLLTLFWTLHIKSPVSWPCKLMVTLETLVLSCWAAPPVSDGVFVVQVLGDRLWSLVCISDWPSKVKVNITSSPSEEQLTFICSGDKHTWDIAGWDTGAGRQTHT